MSEVIERVARAIDDERHRWTGRTNKARSDGRLYEVCRFDDTGLAGSFSEVHAFTSYDESLAFQRRMVRERSARAAIEALREPTWEMGTAGKLAVKGCESTFERDIAETAWDAMIDAILNEKPAAS